jgi:hypothetical protein
LQRYYFHSEDGYAFRDEEGTLLPNDEAARIEAARVLGQMVNEQPGAVWCDDQFRITVTDDAGVILYVLDLAAMRSPAASTPRPVALPGERPG